LATVCDTEGAPQAVKDAAHHWYAQGWLRLDAIIKELERLDE